ncbi:MAG: hypothetical protein ABJC89_10485, partial [Acidobacteriota bacterium]
MIDPVFSAASPTEHAKKAAAAGRKPNSVRLDPPASEPCDPNACERRRDDHSSSPAITGGIKQPT